MRTLTRAVGRADSHKKKKKSKKKKTGRKFVFGCPFSAPFFSFESQLQHTSTIEDYH
jgi:hypothetical protein